MAPEAGPDYPNRPIRPEEVLATKAETFPDEVYIAVNGLIAEQLHGQYARLTVKALVKRMEELGLDGKEVKRRGWDRVGAIYKQAGWDVTYHYPSWYDDDRDFDPYYYFGTKGPRSW
jgi:hypothetical protein